MILTRNNRHSTVCISKPCSKVGSPCGITHQTEVDAVTKVHSTQLHSGGIKIIVGGKGDGINGGCQVEHFVFTEVVGIFHHKNVLLDACPLYLFVLVEILDKFHFYGLKDSLDILSPFDYSLIMYIIKKMPQFDRWLDHLRDRPTRVRLLRRLEKAQRGLLGDVSPVGDGVHEMREFFGSGWRMYFIQRGEMLIIMLGGGDKSSQAKDIAAAKSLATTIKE